MSDTQSTWSEPKPGLSRRFPIFLHISRSSKEEAARRFSKKVPIATVRPVENVRSGVRLEVRVWWGTEEPEVTQWPHCLCDFVWFLWRNDVQCRSVFSDAGVRAKLIEARLQRAELRFLHFYCIIRIDHRWSIFSMNTHCHCLQHSCNMQESHITPLSCSVKGWKGLAPDWHDHISSHGSAALLCWKRRPLLRTWSVMVWVTSTFPALGQVVLRLPTRHDGKVMHDLLLIAAGFWPKVIIECRFLLKRSWATRCKLKGPLQF